MSDTMILWTRQRPEVWETLQKDGVYRVKKEYVEIKNDNIANYYLMLYDWYTKKAKEFYTVPDGVEYPIWLSVSEESMLQLVEDTVILKLEVPKESIVICNMEAWEHRGNCWYVPLDNEDANKHNAELKKLGISAEDDIVLTSKGNFYPILKRKIISSWDRVFTLTPTLDNSLATIWEIKKEWVKEVRRMEE